MIDGMRFAVVFVVALLSCAWVQAQEPAKVDPRVAALGQMVQEAQQREALALMRAIAAEQRLAALEATKSPAAPPDGH